MERGWWRRLVRAEHREGEREGEGNKDSHKVKGGLREGKGGSAAKKTAVKANGRRDAEWKMGHWGRSDTAGTAEGKLNKLACRDLIGWYSNTCVYLHHPSRGRKIKSLLFQITMSWVQMVLTAAGLCVIKQEFTAARGSVGLYWGTAVLWAKC